MSRIITTAVYNLGTVMHRHRTVIQTIQWCVVAIYLFLLIVPSFLPLPPRQEHILGNLVLFAQFVFWGIWWPFVILSMLFIGRIWCGVFCPEGALAEYTSRTVGRNKTIPRWLKWRGWPTVAFILTTLYGQLISVYDYAEAALLILGGSTLAAMVIGFFFGKGTRVWCRYLCPVNGVFNLLSRLAPISFKTDQEKWAHYCGGRQENPNCPPMINIHQLHGVNACHMCARCAGFRDAVALKPRSVMEEVVVYGEDKNANPWETRLLLFGMIGVAIGAFTWTVSPWFVTFKQAIAEWLVDHNIFWPLDPTAPWWILTNHPANNDSFNWVDGFCVASYILGSGVLFGTFLTLMLWAIAALMRSSTLYHHLAQAFLPLAAAGLFLGLTATTIKLLMYDGVTFWWLPYARAFILALTALWSLYLAARILQRTQASLIRKYLSFFLFAVSCVPIVYAWWLMFWGW